MRLQPQFNNWLSAQMHSQLYNQVGWRSVNRLWTQIDALLWGQLWDQMNNRLRNRLWSQLWNQLGSPLPRARQ